MMQYYIGFVAILFIICLMQWVKEFMRKDDLDRATILLNGFCTLVAAFMVYYPMAWCIQNLWLGGGE